MLGQGRGGGGRVLIRRAAAALQVRKDHFKGMRPHQLEDIREEQKRQVGGARGLEVLGAKEPGGAALLPSVWLWLMGAKKPGGAALLWPVAVAEGPGWCAGGGQGGGAQQGG